MIEKLGDILREVAAEEMLPRFRRLDESERFRKSDGDIVTVVDMAVERRIEAWLRSATPGALIVGEEGAHADPALLDELGEADTAWLIDPLDGTRNFVNGREDFAIMLALLEKGVTTAAWIYAPVSGDLLLTEIGSGAYLNGRKLRVRRRNGPIFSHTGELHVGFLPPELRSSVETARPKLMLRNSRRCAAFTYMSLCREEIAYALYYRTLPWDHAPGNLAFREAGGYGARLNGSPYQPPSRESGLLLASRESNWRELHATLFPSAGRLFLNSDFGG